MRGERRSMMQGISPKSALLYYLPHDPSSRSRSTSTRPAISSVLPEAIKSPTVHLRITRRVIELPMTEISRERPSIHALVHQFKSAGMAQQMRMHACHADADRSA